MHFLLILISPDFSSPLFGKPGRGNFLFPPPYPVSRWYDEKGGTESLYEGRIIMYSIFSQHGNALERRFRGELLRIEPWGEKSFRVRATCLPQLPAGLNMGLTGIPWWTTDIGGFLGGNPDDPTAWDIQDEYLLGGDVLVAPILFEGQRSRRVYLPGKDTWKNAHTGESFSGGQWVEAEAPPDVIPVFLREGGAADFAL